MLQQFGIVVCLVLVFIVFKQFLAGDIASMNVQELKKIWKSEKENPGEVLVDVREPDEYKGGHAPGARNIPLSSIGTRSQELSTFATLYVICERGGRSATACQTLSGKLAKEVKVLNIEGGTSAWKAAGFPLEK